MSVVLILHLGLLKLPWTSRPAKEPAAFESIVMLLSDETPPPEPLFTPSSVKDAKPRSPVNTHPIELKKPDDPPEVAPTPSANEENAPTPLEWRVATDAAIQSAVKKITAKPTTRRFGESTQKPQSASEPPALFAEPAHRFGETTKTPDGDSIVWLTENCYQVANSDSSRFKSFAFGMPDTTKTYVRCKQSIGKAQSNPHLFDYLKHKAETTE